MLLENIDNQKNEKNHQGNRRYSILLLALLFIGMATYGTYAYFTDSTSVDGNIKLETGTVKFDELNPTNWEYQGDVNKKIDKKSAKHDFANVQPGDTFVKKVEVEYVGTLDGTVSVNQFTEKDKEKFEGLDYEITVQTPNEENTITKDETVIVTLTAKVPTVEEGKNQEDYQGKTYDLSQLSDAVVLKVTQITASE